MELQSFLKFASGRDVGMTKDEAKLLAETFKIDPLPGSKFKQVPHVDIAEI